MKRNQDHFRGCLLGGAIGDALGWPVEFLKRKEIISQYGKDGIIDLYLKNGVAEITDDTQMTLFTAEGILRAQARGMEKGICHPPSVVYYAYQRWLHTQGYPKNKELDWIYDGWLINVDKLHERRGPGNTCLTALLSEEQGTLDRPINDSKGCGGIMRSAPIGLFYPKEDAFKIAVDSAALTHGHPSGYLSAGSLAYIIACIIEGLGIEEAVEKALTELNKYKDHEECTLLVQRSLELSSSDIEPIKAIEQLGEGWIGEEALAISIYCALKYKKDYRKAIITAVNHNGDSDSTGAITGNILGSYLGLSNIPKKWTENVELQGVITQIADDLLTRYEENAEWWNRYPGY